MSSPRPYASPFVNSKFSMTATIGGVEFRDIISFSATFGLNSIPVAQLVVASGREVNSNKLATIHTPTAKAIDPGAQAVVEITITNTDGQLDKMETGSFVVFRGKYAGLGYQRGYNSANYVIHLVHWLDNLNQGSMVNGNWFPGAPYDLAQNAGYYGIDNSFGGGAGVNAAWSPTPAIDTQGQFVTYRNIETDFWGKVIKPIFETISRWPLPGYQGDKSSNEVFTQGVRDALDRMPGASKQYPGLPLSMDGLTDYVNTQDSIRRALVKDGISSFAYTTFWNKLVGEYAPQFYFAISPAVEWALPIPFFAGLKTEYKQILSDEYNYANLSASMLQQLESVDIFYPVQGDTGYGLAPSEALGRRYPEPTFQLPCGYYPPLDAPRNIRGLKLLKEPPTWMTNIFPGPGCAADAAGTGGVPKDACVNGGKKALPDDLCTGADTVAQFQESRAATRFAEHWYKTEVLYQRQGEMSGKLRFDIAPGSVVKIETPPRDLAHNSPDWLYATVTQVSFVINAEKATAGTSFSLAHIRTEHENERPTLTSPIPPLYKAAWAGGPLTTN